MSEIFSAQNLAFFGEAVQSTLIVTIVSTLLAYLIGVPLGVALILTDKDGLRPMRAFNAVLGWIVNVGRSIPFVILMLVMIACLLAFSLKKKKN